MGWNAWNGGKGAYWNGKGLDTAKGAMKGKESWGKGKGKGQGMTNAGCFGCGGLDHKVAQCLKGKGKGGRGQGKGKGGRSAFW